MYAIKRYVQKLPCKKKYLHCSNEAPIKLHYSLDGEDSIDSINYVRFFVAPRIEED